MGLILSMFSWGFIFGHLSGGIAADRLNIRRWGTFFFLLWCVATFLTGLCHTVLQFAIARLVFGYSEGAFINPMNKLQNHWVLPSERGLVNGSLMFAAYLGLVGGMPLVGWLIDMYGWREMFFISGVLSLVGALAWWLVVYDYPKDHPRISALERTAIETALAQDRVTYDVEKHAPVRLSFKAAALILFRNRIFWAICGACFFVQMIYVTNFSWLPSYLVLERGFSGIKSGNALAIPYLAAAFGALSGGFISDRIGSRTLVIMFGAVLTIPAIIGLLTLQNERAVLLMIGLVLFFNAAAVSVFVVLLFDLFPPEIAGVRWRSLSACVAASVRRRGRSSWATPTTSRSPLPGGSASWPSEWWFRLACLDSYSLTSVVSDARRGRAESLPRAEDVAVENGRKKCIAPSKNLNRGTCRRSHLWPPQIAAAQRISVSHGCIQGSFRDGTR